MEINTETEPGQIFEVETSKLENKAIVVKFEYQFEFINNNVMEDEWLKSTEFANEEIPGVKFWIEAQLCCSNTLINIRVWKNNLKKSIAVVHVYADEFNHRKRVVDWASYHDTYCHYYTPIGPIEYSRADPRTIAEKSKVTINCMINWHGFIEDYFYPDTYPHMKHYYKNEEFSDMILKIKDAEFPVHKIVIAHQSPVFHKMLTSDMKEAKESCILLPDVDSELMEELLLFFYKGKMGKAERDTEIVLKLFKFANMYLIDKLQKTCEYFLIKNLNVNNAFTIHDEGKIFNSVILQQHALTFIDSLDIYDMSNLEYSEDTESESDAIITLQDEFHFTEKDQWLKSSQITSDIIPNIKFRIEAKLNNAENIISVRIGNNSFKKSITLMSIMMFDDGNCLISNKKCIYDWIEYNISHDFKIPLRSLLIKNLGTKCFEFTIYCCMRWHGFVEDLYCPEISPSVSSYYKNRDFSDLLIKIKDAEFTAHKIVVASQSPVFKQMIAPDMEDNSIYLPDVDSDMMEELLLYFYKGKLEKAETDAEMGLKLLEFANTYQIEKLKKSCEYCLIVNLSIDNVFAVYKQATICRSVLLQHHAIFFVANNYENIICSP